MSDWKDRHSVTCGVCEELFDERDRGDNLGIGAICPGCLPIVQYMINAVLSYTRRAGLGYTMSDISVEILDPDGCPVMLDELLNVVRTHKRKMNARARTAYMMLRRLV